MKSPKAATITSVVEHIGLGPAQWRVLLLSTGGVSVCDGIELMLGNVIVTSVSNEFGLGVNERALMTTMTLLGFMTGHFLSGYAGDVWGRQTPVLWSFMLTTVLGFACAAMPTFYWLVCARCVLGIGMGLGMPPAAAMTSEVTPERFRIAMRVVLSCFFSVGYFFIALCSAFDDPMYQKLHWRLLMIVGAAPPAVFTVLCYCFMYESPVFLAAVGKHAEAKEVFRWMAKMNSTDCCDLEYSMRSGTDAPRPQISVREQLRMVFSDRLRYTTIAVVWACFCINLVSYGDGYAAPQVLGYTSQFPPAWRSVIKSGMAVLWVLIAGALAQALSRKTMVSLATVVSSTVCFAFALSGPCPLPRPPMFELVYQYGANGSALGAALGYVVIFQISVEIYPTAASSTGGAIIMGGGRVAAVVAPLLFENFTRLTGHWTVFYYFMGASCLSAWFAAQFMPDISAYRPGEEIENDMESGAISLKDPSEHAKLYGSAAKRR